MTMGYTNDYDSPSAFGCIVFIVVVTHKCPPTYVHAIYSSRAKAEEAITELKKRWATWGSRIEIHAIAVQ